MTFPVLEGKVAAVTGAAVGMGKARAKGVVADFNVEKGQAVVEAIKTAGDEASFVKADGSDLLILQVQPFMKIQGIHLANWL